MTKRIDETGMWFTPIYSDYDEEEGVIIFTMSSPEEAEEVHQEAIRKDSFPTVVRGHQVLMRFGENPAEARPQPD